jgi:hypothetical protein
LVNRQANLSDAKGCLAILVIDVCISTVSIKRRRQFATIQRKESSRRLHPTMLLPVTERRGLTQATDQALILGPAPD